MAVSTIANGIGWTDSGGDVIRAHGGGFLQHEGRYYWFGENRTHGKLVSCYCSTDLMSWEFRNDVVTRDTHPELSPCNAERPKVIYNDRTGKYVMWLHWENGIDYGQARCAVLVSDTVDGNYTYLKSFRPEGHMSRDCTLYKDDDGTAYFISAARENADLHVYRLTDDYQDIVGLERILWPGQKREAPALVKRGDYYFLVTSGCTGWEPNQGKYAYSKSILGPWSDLLDLGSPTTYDTQPTYILTVNGSEETTYLYVGDRWDPSDYHNSTYAFLPLHFPTDTSMELKWVSSLAVDVRTGRVVTSCSDSGLWRLRMGMRYLAATCGDPDSLCHVVGSRLSYADNSQLWVIEESECDSIRIRHRVSGRYAEPEDGSCEPGARIALAPRCDHPRQEWQQLDAGSGHVKLVNRHSGLALRLDRDSRGSLVQCELDQSPGGPWDHSSVLLAMVYQ